MNKLQYTFFSGGYSQTTGGEVKEVTFQELASEFSKVESGKKDGSYIVRGALTDNTRKNANLKSSELLIIDADAATDGESAPDPKLLHALLKKRNISHFIYTSHSHTAEKNKYRAVVHCDMPDKDALDPAVVSIFKVIHKANIPIANANENSTWSQAWYMPRRKDADDGLFRYFEHFGSKYIPTLTQDDTPAEKPLAKEDYEAKILALEPGLHENILSLSMKMVASGDDPSEVKVYMHNLLNKCPAEAQGDRWAERKADIDRDVDGAAARVADEGVNTIKKQHEEEEAARCVQQSTKHTSTELITAKENRDILPLIQGHATREPQGDTTVYMLRGMDIPATDAELPEANELHVPMPTGLLGDFVRSAYFYQRYRSLEVAMTTVMGFLAGACGRAFNYDDPEEDDGLGLNMYITMMMDSGFGKESIVNYINELSFMFSEVEEIDVGMFIGENRFTGGKAVNNTLQARPSCLCIMQEAGISWDSKSGDLSSTMQSFLDLYSKSGVKAHAKSGMYSNTEDSTAQLLQPSLSLIQEATPKSLKKAMLSREFVEKGFASRNTVFQVYDRPRRNKSIRVMTEPLMNRLRYVLTLACKYNNEYKEYEEALSEGIEGGLAAPMSPPKVHKMFFETPELEKEATEWGHYMDDVVSTFSSIDPLRSIMATRAYTKALKFASLCGLFNNGNLLIKKADWEWGRAMQEYEYATLEKYSSGDSGLEEAAMKSVGQKIHRLLSNSSSSKNAQVTHREFDQRLVKISALKQLLNKNAVLRDLADDAEGRNPQSGLEKVINYLRREKHLLEKNLHYQISPVFITMIEAEYGTLEFKQPKGK